MTIATVLTALYGLVGVVVILSMAITYYATYKSIKAQNTENSSLAGWVLSFLSMVVSSLYATVVVHDLLFSVISVCSMIGSALMVHLLYSRKSAQETPSAGMD